MNERYARIQYLIGVSAGFTCLGLSLLVYQAEGACVAHDWIRQRTSGAFLLLFFAVMWLFIASRYYTNMLFARLAPTTADSSSAGKQGAPEQPTEPVRAGRVVTLAVLVTLVVAAAIELSGVLLDSGGLLGQ